MGGGLVGVRESNDEGCCGYTKEIGYCDQAGYGDAILSGFVFIDLLIGYTEFFGQVVPRYIPCITGVTNPISDLCINSDLCVRAPNRHDMDDLL